MDSAARRGLDKDARVGDGDAAVIFGDGFGGAANPEGDGFVREIEWAFAEVELDICAADGKGLGGSYGLSPGRLEGCEYSGGMGCAEKGNRRGGDEGGSEDSAAGEQILPRRQHLMTNLQVEPVYF